MKKYLSILFLIAFIIPSIAFASWWNPFTWFRKNTKPTEQPVVQVQQNNSLIKDAPKSEENKITKNKTTTTQKPKPTKKVNTPEYAPLKPFVPPPSVITPPETPVFYIQAPDGTMWQGYTKAEAQEKADQYMKSLDTKPPIVRVQKVTDKLLSTFPQFFPDNAFKGVVGLNLDYEDPIPSSGMFKFEYYMDDIPIGSLINNLAQKIAWDTTKYSDGTHTLTGKAYDKAGNVGSDSVSVVIKNNK